MEPPAAGILKSGPVCSASKNVSPALFQKCSPLLQAQLANTLSHDENLQARPHSAYGVNFGNKPRQDLYVRMSLQRVSWGLPAPGSKKCPKQSRNSLRSLKTVYFETPETASRLFRTVFGPRGRKAPGDSLETLSGFRARRARETPVRGGRGCNPWIDSACAHCPGFWSRCCWVTRLPALSRSLRTSICFMALWTFPWIWCPQLLHQACENGTDTPVNPLVFTMPPVHRQEDNPPE